jgi:hypothetical protein
MDKLKNLTDAERKAYGMGIYSDRLLSLKIKCPEDGTWMNATGNMYLDNHWIVEYLCPKDKELFNIWTPAIDALTKQIAKDVMEKSKKDE